MTDRDESGAAPSGTNPGMDEIVSGDDARRPDKRRRRLVKGALAVPTFMTLHSGAAAAQAITSNVAVVTQEPDEAYPVDVLRLDEMSGEVVPTEEPGCYLPERSVGDGNKVDLGDNPMAMNPPDPSGDPVFVDGACENPLVMITNSSGGSLLPSGGSFV